MNPPNNTENARQNKAAKIIAYVIAGIIALAALITATLYDWTNKEPNESTYRLTSTNVVAEGNANLDSSTVQALQS